MNILNISLKRHQKFFEKTPIDVFEASFSPKDSAEIHFYALGKSLNVTLLQRQWTEYFYFADDYIRPQGYMLPCT